MQQEWYTRKQVAERLGISLSTVYHYAKQGKIKKIPDPHRLHREARYEKAEVDQLAKENERYPEGLSPSDVAKQLGLSPQTVYNYIREGTIQAQEVPFGDERITYVITTESFEEAKKNIHSARSERIRKHEYYVTTYEIALYQLFQTPHKQTARVMINAQKDWGFYLHHSQKWVPYEKGIQKYGLLPVYSIHHEPLEHKGYVYFNIPIVEDMLYPFIDYLYSTWGIENVGVREMEEEHFVYIQVKAGERPFEDLPFEAEELQGFIHTGTIEYSEGLLILRSSYRKTNLELPIKMLTDVKELAKAENISISHWIEKAIEQALSNK